MKKFLSVASMLLFVLATLTSCSSSSPQADKETDTRVHTEGAPPYRVFVYGFTDSINAAKHEVEYAFADPSRYENDEPETAIEISINGEPYEGFLKMTQYQGFNYFPVYRYGPKEGGKFDFELDDANQLVSCFWGRSNKEGELPRDACIEVAVDFMKNLIDLSQYTVSVTTDEEGERYIVNFDKYVDGIKTTDSATVTVQYNGELYGYSSSMLGRVSTDITVDNIDFDAAASLVNSRLDQIYEDVKNKYSYIEYEEPSVLLTVLKDGSIGLIYIVDVHCVNIIGEYKVVTSERMNFVVSVG